MRLFHRNPPKACPKCGKADGWRCVPDATPQSEVMSASAVNPFAGAPIRNTFGQNLTASVGRTSSKLLYRCESCGYEKRF